LGETGEWYLVGPDKRIRSDSSLDKTGHMRAIGYPYLELHSEIHRELLASLDEIVAHPRTHAQVPFSLRDLLLDWFVGHILTQDHDYARFARVLRMKPKQTNVRS